MPKSLLDYQLEELTRKKKQREASKRYYNKKINMIENHNPDLEKQILNLLLVPNSPKQVSSILNIDIDIVKQYRRKLRVPTANVASFFGRPEGIPTEAELKRAKYLIITPKEIE